MVRLKHSLPFLFFLLVLTSVVLLSFKRTPAPTRVDTSAASVQEQMDQISLSAMHAEPAPLASPQAMGGIAAITPPSPEDLNQAKVLEEILAAHNDNDSRMDKELRILSPEAKRLFRSRYATTAAEKRNQRGTIVFLMGRDLKSPEDVAFLRSVLNESPCLSLSNCAVEETSSAAAHDSDHDGASEITLAYPQLTALKAIEAYLSSPDQGPLSPDLLAVLENARRSRVDKVAALAEKFSREYHAKHP